MSTNEDRVHTLMYTAMAKKDITPEDLENILAKSRENNHRKGITGALFYKNGQFLQLLEGPEKDVEDLLLTIHNDTRQRGLVVLHRSKQPRIFNEWTMDFANLDEMRREDYVLDLIQLPWSVDNLKKAPHRVRKLMIKFNSGRPLFG